MNIFYRYPTFKDQLPIVQYFIIKIPTPEIERKWIYYMLQDNQVKNHNLATINSAVVIPALNPMPDLVSFVQVLLNKGIPQVIVVNDGSDPIFDNIFRKIGDMECCTLLVHHVNRGKGRALKTAFAYFLENFPYMDGVVTADADGQHSIDDIINLCKELSKTNGSLILGMRNFKNDNVPKRSYMGNRITSSIFRFLYGSYIEDTQTGLRGIPAKELSWMVKMKGERYEYEINMLIQSKLRNINFTTVTIQTLYFDNNSGSHYNTIMDSARIFLCLISGFIKYSLSGLVSGLIDVAVFYLLNSILLAFLSISERLFISTVTARILSSCCNFSINRNLFSAHMEKQPRFWIRYYILWLIQLIASYGLIYAASLRFNIHQSILKICIDIILGILSYQIQLRWVFKNKDIGIGIRESC